MRGPREISYSEKTSNSLFPLIERSIAENYFSSVNVKDLRAANYFPEPFSWLKILISPYKG
jgi:hypothetical protein